MKRLIIDIDNTICVTNNQDYKNSLPDHDVIEKIHEYKNAGFEIVFFTSRNMRTHNGNLGLINKLTLPVIMQWLEKHSIHYDEIYVGKPWCGTDGFYVDDKAIRPDEFKSLSYEKIRLLIGEGL
ncbi:capsular biosynthesis protein [Cobetia crustatorum]|uniref:capsular biosynthesis protein n=1 Tax=Cobetia crustatorum TaxID=553385 RepID=UPI000A04653E|nr:capsular biosynthesis protein [Cobetia crustatorum]